MCNYKPDFDKDDLLALDVLSEEDIREAEEKSLIIPERIKTDSINSLVLGTSGIGKLLHNNSC